MRPHPLGRRAFKRAESGPPPPPSAPKTLHDLLALHERLIIIQSLQKHAFSRTLAAKNLGVTRNYLWRRMKLLKIDFSALPRTTPGRPRKKYT